MTRPHASRPDIPQAARYEMYACNDPNCGPHFLLFDGNDRPVMEMVANVEGAQRMITALQKLLYDKLSDQL